MYFRHRNTVLPLSMISNPPGEDTGWDLDSGNNVVPNPEGKKTTEQKNLIFLYSIFFVYYIPSS